MIDDDEAYGLHCDIGRLEQENARLRELMYDRAHAHAIQHMTEDELRITLANALDENRKLRELVRDINECLEHCKLVCEYCKFQGVDCQWFKFIKRMRELGVEVK